MTMFILFFIILEILVFAGASLFHFGMFQKGYEHPKARIAELVIAIILLTGLISGLIFPDQLRIIALIVQAIALFGTLIGIFTIVVGVGPRSVPDYLFHLSMITLLVTGLLTIY